MSVDVKIFVSNRIDLESEVILNEVYTPVRCGAVFDQRGKNSIVGDDGGENISDKRESYCELTVQYWAWKNVNADYYGLCHYRRYLSFEQNCSKKLNDWSIVEIPRLTNKSISENRLDDCEHIKEVVSHYDVVTMVPCNLGKVGRKSVYEQYRQDGLKLKTSDLDVILDIIKEKYPQFVQFAEKYLNGQKMYYGNIFIMKKEIFHNYSQWLFDILFEFEKRVDISDYSLEGYRTPGHLAERLFGVYYTWLLEEKHVASLELPLVMFHDTRKRVEVTPAFDGRAVPIVMATSNGYAPFCATTIASILDNSNSTNQYDLFVLHYDLTTQNKERISSIVKKTNNFKLRFLCVKDFIDGYNLYESKRIPKETYFRLVIPELIKCYDKVLYLDSDLIVLRDLAELYSTDVGKNLLGAVLDVCEAGEMNGLWPDQRKYVQKNMRISCLWKQFNAGVLIVNSRAFRENFTTRFLLEFVEAGAFRYQDQDALNVLCENRVFWLDNRWNFAADPRDSHRGWVTSFAPKKCYQAYLEASKDPWIVHYAGNEKPWYDCGVEWSEYFWNYLPKTPYYHLWLRQRCNDYAWACKSKDFDLDSVHAKKLRKQYKRAKFKYLEYSLLSKLSWGKLNEKFNEKKRFYRAQVSFFKRK